MTNEQQSPTPDAGNNPQGHLTCPCHRLEHIIQHYLLTGYNVHFGYHPGKNFQLLTSIVPDEIDTICPDLDLIITLS